jgi:hypothetical protein
MRWGVVQIQAMIGLAWLVSPHQAGRWFCSLDLQLPHLVKIDEKVIFCEAPCLIG